jgi:glycosyltransferase involved in cell wall biosynthesis
MRLAEQLPQGPVASTPSVAPRPDAALSTSPASSNGAARPITVLIAGHDFKFTRPPREAIAAAGGTVLEDPWKNHVDHDEAISRAALEKADVIHCEWCLGNAAWYSRNKRPGQRLLIRLYRVEVYSDYPAAVDMANVDQIAFDSQHILEEAIERFGWDPAKLTVIPNGVDADRLRCPKQETARHTLAMVGYIPRRKRLDRALDILEQLRREDPRFRLILIGHPPSELRWVARDSDEIEFFRECFVRIQSTEMLRGAVFFKPFTGDVPAFFQQAGFVLSTSDSEGHQVALAEGTASGAIPVIIDRPGAHDQYPPHWIHARASEAASAIRIFEEDFKAKSAEAADHADHWSLQKIWPRWIDSLSLSNGAEPIYDTRERNR